MKKIVLVVSLILALSVFFGACAKKENDTETTSATQIISTTKEPKETFGDFLGTVVPGKFTSTEAEEFYYLLVENFSSNAEVVSINGEVKTFNQENVGIKFYNELKDFCGMYLNYLDSIPWKSRPVDSFSGDDSFAKLSENCSLIITQRGYGSQSLLLRYNTEELPTEILLLKDYNVATTERVAFSGRYLSYLDGFYFNGKKLECDLVPISHMSDYSSHGNNDFILASKGNQLFFLVSKPGGIIEEILIGEYLDDIKPFQYYRSIFFLGTDGNVVQADLEKGFSVRKTEYDSEEFSYGNFTGSYVFVGDKNPETYIDLSGAEREYEYDIGV